jgi:hypothetical protein
MIANEQQALDQMEGADELRSILRIRICLCPMWDILQVGVNFQNRLADAECGPVRNHYLASEVIQKVEFKGGPSPRLLVLVGPIFLAHFFRGHFDTPLFWWAIEKACSVVIGRAPIMTLAPARAATSRTTSSVSW